jgi:hypothetical protein
MHSQQNEWIGATAGTASCSGQYPVIQKETEWLSEDISPRE